MRLLLGFLLKRAPFPWAPASGHGDDLAGTLRAFTGRCLRRWAAGELSWKCLLAAHLRRDPGQTWRPKLLATARGKWGADMEDPGSSAVSLSCWLGKNWGRSEWVVVARCSALECGWKRRLAWGAGTVPAEGGASVLGRWVAGSLGRWAEGGNLEAASMYHREVGARWLSCMHLAVRSRLRNQVRLVVVRWDGCPLPSQAA